MLFVEECATSCPRSNFVPCVFYIYFHVHVKERERERRALRRTDRGELERLIKFRCHVIDVDIKYLDIAKSVERLQ